MTSRNLRAGSTFPAMTLPLLRGGERDLSKAENGFDWTIVVVYRGKHCPICVSYLQSLNTALPELNKLGVDAVAVSADTLERATIQMAEVSPKFDVAYGLTVAQMNELGLFISGPRNGIDVE